MASGNLLPRNEPPPIQHRPQATTSNSASSTPGFSSTKGAAVPPITVSGDLEDQLELRDMIASSPTAENMLGGVGSGRDYNSLPLEEDIMKLAILGDERGVRDLLASGKVDARYCDADGTTPLHVRL